jgi:hypothetical protein
LVAVENLLKIISISKAKRILFVSENIRLCNRRQIKFHVIDCSSFQCVWLIQLLIKIKLSFTTSNFSFTGFWDYWSIANQFDPWNLKITTKSWHWDLCNIQLNDFSNWSLTLSSQKVNKNQHCWLFHIFTRQFVFFLFDCYFWACLTLYVLIGTCD